MVRVLNQKDAADIVNLIITHLVDWPMRSAETFRNAVMGDGLITINPMLGVNEDRDLQYITGVLQQTIAEGRMIDFGFVPNTMIKQESIRSRRMFEADEFTHPFETWIGLMPWEGGYNAYFVTKHPEWKGAILMIEMYGVVTPSGNHGIMIFDIISINVMGMNDTRVSPAHMNYPGGGQPTKAELRNRGANCLDPLVTMLRLLADASIPVEYKPAPERLNKARAKQGKHPIPGHTVVHARDYVTSFTQRASQRGPGQGGHHASPIAHWRREHIRHLADGRIVPVKSSKVNWRDSEELHRMFYKVKEQK